MSDTTDRLDEIRDREAEVLRLVDDRQRWRSRYYDESRTYWDAELPPGGECCADCGQPVESEPCPDHHPATVAARLSARVAELEAQRERRRLRLIALQNDALNMRGALSPIGEDRKVPFELGETLTPAVEWLIGRVAELEGAAGCPSRITTSVGVSECALLVRHQGDHRNTASDHYWDDEHADEHAPVKAPLSALPPSKATRRVQESMRRAVAELDSDDTPEALHASSGAVIVTPHGGAQ